MEKSHFYVIGRKNDNYYYLDDNTFTNMAIFAHQFDTPKLARNKMKKLKLEDKYYEVYKVSVKYTTEPVKDDEEE